MVNKRLIQPSSLIFSTVNTDNHYACGLKKEVRLNLKGRTKSFYC